MATGGGSQTLTLRMQSRGTRTVKRDVDDVGKGVRRIGKSSKDANKNTGLFARGLSLLGTRMGMVTAAAILLSPAIAASIPAIAVLTSGLLAFGALAIPILAIAAGLMMRYKDTANIAGSAASELADVLANLKHAFNIAISPAAATVMRGASQALLTLLDTVEAFRGPLSVFAGYMAQAMQVVAEGLRDAAPGLQQLITMLGPVLLIFAHAIGPLVEGLTNLATLGVPVMMWLAQALVNVSFWLVKVTTDLINWVHSAQGMSVINTAFAAVISAGQYLRGVFTDLWGIATQLFVMFSGEGAAGAGALQWAALALADAIHWINVNFQALQPVIYGALAAFLAYRGALMVANIVLGIWNGLQAIAAAATLVWAAAMWVLDAAVVVLTSPIFLAVAAVAALAAGFYYAYTHSETLRNALSQLWNILKSTPGAIASVATTIYNTLGAALDWLMPKIEAVTNFLGKITGGHVGSLLGLPHIPGIPFMAAGGDVVRSGPHVVGEEGPEVVNLRRGDHVTPNDELGGGGGGDFVIPVTLVMPDGDVLARTTVRSAKKKASTR